MGKSCLRDPELLSRVGDLSAAVLDHQARAGQRPGRSDEPGLPWSRKENRDHDEIGSNTRRPPDGREHQPEPIPPHDDVVNLPAPSDCGPYLREFEPPLPREHPRRARSVAEVVAVDDLRVNAAGDLDVVGPRTLSRLCRRGALARRRLPRPRRHKNQR